MLLKRSLKGKGDLEIESANRDHPNYRQIENGQHTEKNLGNLRTLAGPQTPVKDHQLTLM